MSFEEEPLSFAVSLLLAPPEAGGRAGVAGPGGERPSFARRVEDSAAGLRKRPARPRARAPGRQPPSSPEMPCFRQRPAPHASSCFGEKEDSRPRFPSLATVSSARLTGPSRSPGRPPTPAVSRSSPAPAACALRPPQPSGRRRRVPAAQRTESELQGAQGPGAAALPSVHLWPRGPPGPWLDNVV